MSIEFYQDPFKFPGKCHGFRLELVDEFTKIVPRTFRPIIGHYLGLLACIKSVFLRVFVRVFRLFITLQNYINSELDKTEMLMNLKNRKLSKEIEYYKKYGIFRKRKLNSLASQFYPTLRFRNFVVIKT